MNIFLQKIQMDSADFKASIYSLLEVFIVSDEDISKIGIIKKNRFWS